MDELQAHINPAFQPFGLEGDGYLSGASSQLSLKESLFSQDETESPTTVVMSVMVTEVNNEEQLVMHSGAKSYNL